MPGVRYSFDSSAPKRATNIRLNADLLKQAGAQRWLEENHGALESSNDYVEAHGLPLAGCCPY